MITLRRSEIGKLIKARGMKRTGREEMKGTVNGTERAKGPQLEIDQKISRCNQKLKNDLIRHQMKILVQRKPKIGEYLL